MTDEVTVFYDEYLKTLKGEELIKATQKRDDILQSLEKKKARQLLEIAAKKEIRELEIQKEAQQTELQQSINADGKITKEEEKTKKEILKLEQKFNLQKRLINLETQRELGAISQEEFETRKAYLEALIAALDNEKPENIVKKFLGLSIEDWKKASKEIGDVLQEILGHWEDFTDKWIAELDRRIDRQDQAVLETQNQIMIEQENREQGFSNHLRAEEQKLAELKDMREKALKEREEATRIEGILDTITQASSLVTAVANIYKGMSSIFPVIGIPLATALSAAMIGSFITSKALIKQKTGHLAEGDYGTTKGRRHSEGGENFLDHLEVEDGEMWSVYNRKGSARYPKQIAAFTDAVNKGKLHSVWNSMNMGLNQDKFEILPYPMFDDSKIAETNEILNKIVSQNKEIPKDMGNYITFEKDGIIYKINK
jgi:DNA repair exonuclease SbcCD ATPase subunit